MQLLDQVDVLRIKSQGIYNFFQAYPTSEIYDYDIIEKSFNS